MSTKYKFQNPQGLYFVTLRVKHWVDVFTRREYKDIIVESLAYCQNNKGLEIFAWVLMSNHLHLIVACGERTDYESARAEEGRTDYISARAGENSLEDILRDFKKFTCKSIIKEIEDNPQESRKEWLLRCFKTTKGNSFWQDGNYPIELWTNAVIKEKLEYLHGNPVKSGIVNHAEDYLFSSAIDYSGGEGLLSVYLLDV